MKQKRGWKIILACFLILTMLVPGTALAAGMIDTGHAVTLTLSCRGQGDSGLYGQQYDIYRVADVDPYGELTVTKDFEAFNVNITGQNDDAWRNLASTLEGYVLQASSQGSLKPADSGRTDAQGNLTQMLGWPQPDELSPTLADLMGKIITDQTVSANEGILHHDSGVDLLPANIELSALEVTLVNAMSRETVMRQLLSTVQDRYDYALIDCMPSLGMLTLNALSAADSVIIPVQAHYLPAKGLEQLLRTVARVKRQLNPKLEIDGIVLTMVDGRTTLAKGISEQIRQAYAGRVFASEIPRSIRAAEVSVENKSIYDLDRNGKAAQAYENLTREVLNIGRQPKKHRSNLAR